MESSVRTSFLRDVSKAKQPLHVHKDRQINKRNEDLLPKEHGTASYHWFSGDIKVAELPKILFSGPFVMQIRKTKN